MHSDSRLLLEEITSIDHICQVLPDEIMGVLDEYVGDIIACADELVSDEVDKFVDQLTTTLVGLAIARYNEKQNNPPIHVRDIEWNY